MVDKPQVRGLIEMLGEDREEVISEGVAYALAHWPKYDPFEAQPSTFIQQRANSGIYDFLRKSGKQDRIERRLTGELNREDKDLELCDWLRGVYEAARRVFAASKYRQGRRMHNAAQLLALGELMQREHLSCRAVVKLLHDREDLVAAIRLKSIPHFTWVCAARRSLSFRAGQVATESDENGPEVATANG